jgi:hypothetical protein
MSSTLRSFHQSRLGNRYVVIASSPSLYTYNGSSFSIVTSSGPVVSGDVTVGTVLVDLGYEIYDGQTQYRRVTLLHDPTKIAYVRYMRGPGAAPTTLATSGLARI